MTAGVRIGIDLGGTKIAGIALHPDGTWSKKLRRPTPRDSYEGTTDTVADLVDVLRERTSNVKVGIAVPGSLSPVTGRMQNANSVWLNGRDLLRDMQSRLGMEVRIANDANCFAISEADELKARTVFGVILGTGCGGGLAIDGVAHTGPNASCGEWGHTPLPYPTADEFPGPQCWCGRWGCMETWVSGPGLAADHQRMTGQQCSAEEIAIAGQAGDSAANASLQRHSDRLARGLAQVVNIIDPDVIVLGGGLSNLDHLYHVLPDLIRPHVFADCPRISICPPSYGDDSGVRGAARLW